MLPILVAPYGEYADAFLLMAEVREDGRSGTAGAPAAPVDEESVTAFPVAVVPDDAEPVQHAPSAHIFAYEVKEEERGFRASTNLHCRRRQRRRAPTALVAKLSPFLRDCGSPLSSGPQPMVMGLDIVLRCRCRCRKLVT